MGLMDDWLQQGSAISTWTGDSNPSVTYGLLIAEKPQSIVVQRPGSADLPAQTVRLEPTSGPVLNDNQYGGKTDQQWIVVLGYKGHPTVADTDLRIGDQFYIASSKIMYMVHTLWDQSPYCLQALAVASRKG